ncbi:ABC transporter ATP-binding protein [Nocardiopsis tropica]|uniref:ABC transporter ATP-binding protein n=1 Tax=Nocardiopsis tropica TaxID=109330 RepID=A0ABU7KKK6_9ACTN|nr:ABC transporter ATP-binding protein [Nocardiopsis umidischolae]MEE2049824.1 ABC transporter ATP-binding protein [Nocardiopsis umidischolae]
MNKGMAPQEKPMRFRRSLERFISSMRPERAHIVLLLVCGLGAVAMTVVGPRILAWATDTVFEGAMGRQLGAQLPEGLSGEEAAAELRSAGSEAQADMVSAMPGLVVGEGVDRQKLAGILLAAAGVYAVAFLLGVMQARLMAVVVQRNMRRLRSAVEDKLRSTPLSHLDRQRRGDILSRVTNDIDNISQTTNQTLSQIITAALTVVGVLAMMVSISWSLALVVLATVPLSVAVAVFIAKRAQPNFVHQWRATGELNSHVEEVLTGHAVVTVYGRQEAEAQRFAQKNAEVRGATATSQFVSATMHPSLSFLGNLTFVLVAVFGALQVASGRISIGGVQAFLQYSRQFSQPIAQISSMMNLLQSGVASVERVYEFLDGPEEEPDRVSEGEPAPSGPRGRVSFEDTDFSYDPDEPLIRGLNLVAEPGQTLAIVGPSGAGKTTLVNLLMRFYDVTGGRIAVDGTDIRQMTRRHLRSKMGMVLQDTCLFTGTIEENIRYGNPNASQEDFLRATRATYVDHFVRSLPEGYSTVVDDEATILSSGEKQLLTIARAFLSAPEILILDEATSSVDTRTELLIQRAMATLRKDRTAFVIAHRLSTIRDADLIVVMEAGQIVEQGTHHQLLTADGAYARLYAHQSSPSGR